MAGEYKYYDDYYGEVVYEPDNEHECDALAFVMWCKYFSKKVPHEHMAKVIHGLAAMISAEDLTDNEELLERWHDELKDYHEADAFRRKEDLL